MADVKQEYPKALNIAHVLVDSKEEEDAFLEGRAQLQYTKSAQGDTLEVVSFRAKEAPKPVPAKVPVAAPVPAKVAVPVAAPVKVAVPVKVEGKK